jgi:DNA-binding FrmR family transcriptional regulator
MPLMKKDCGCDQNPSHDKALPRLNRAIGQLEGVKRMIADRRYCPEILTLLKGVRSAIKAIESNILKTHLEACVARSFANSRERDKKIAEIKDMLDRFQS